MEMKYPSKTILQFVLVGIILISFLSIAYFLQKNFGITNILESIDRSALLAKTESVKLPIGIKIPAIGVNAHIESVGLTKSGDMDVPKDRLNVALYKFGAYPGDIGTAVIAGHYGWKNNERSAFDDLHKIHEGDRIYIEDEEKKIATFEVYKIQIFDRKADTGPIFNSPDGGSYLNLITCNGAWNRFSRNYDKRLVVFTRLIN